ncbi:uncharacterized protein [Drosophila bipectinata]|uniref:uncharacterized protein n=1 Tax=Drosophila bipectinata TaxID=42026 RepID=UPI001C89069A|nr:uncharacterized protein LOC108123763 [Drosophila bipectinata]
MDAQSKLKPLENPDALLTPKWFWQNYIDNNIVPKSVTDALLKEADPGFTPLSHASKQSIMDYSLRYKPRCEPIPEIKSFGKKLNDWFNYTVFISRDRLNLPTCKAFDIEEYKTQLLPSSKLQNKKKDKKSDATKDKEMTVSFLPFEFSPNLKGKMTYHDYEIIWKRKDENLEICRAVQLMQRMGRALSPAELLVESVKNFWYDDLELQVESKIFLVNRYIFTCFAKKFEDCRGNLLQFAGIQMRMEFLIHLYDWMISEDVTIEINDHLIEYYKAAKFLGIDFLEQQYWTTFSLSGDAGIWEQNAFYIYLLARAENCEDVMSMMMVRIRKSFLPLVASHEFLEFNANEVAFLLAQDTICVNSEDEVFFSAVLWLEYRWEERKKDTAFVMSSVRFAHISPWLRLSLTNRKENSIIKEIMKDEKVLGYLWLANKYCQARIYNQCQVIPTHINAIKELMEAYNSIKIEERFWVYCLGVAHHHDNECCRYRELTYETFKRFLHRLMYHAESFMEDLKFIPNRIGNHYICCYDKVMKLVETRQCPRPLFYTKALNSQERK